MSCSNTSLTSSRDQTQSSGALSLPAALSLHGTLAQGVWSRSYYLRYSFTSLTYRVQSDIFRSAKNKKIENFRTEIFLPYGKIPNFSDINFVA